MIARRSMRSFRTSLMPKDRQEKEKLHSYFRLTVHRTRSLLSILLLSSLLYYFTPNIGVEGFR